MRIATFNLWNTAEKQLARLRAACEELARIDADVVALQEVALFTGDNDVGSFDNASKFISANTQYAHIAFRKYPQETHEGIAFVSKHAFKGLEAAWQTGIDDLQDCGLRVTVEIEGKSVAITNIHLDYKSIAIRERQIVGVNEWIEMREHKGQLEILCGDFNCYPESSVYRFLMGQQTIRDQDTSSWHDLAASYSAKSGMPLLPTLDFANNPRWKDIPTLAIPARFDWILLKDRWPLKSPSVSLVERFGVDATPNAHVVPSDHYGVYADVTA